MEDRPFSRSTGCQLCAELSVSVILTSLRRHHSRNEVERYGVGANCRSFFFAHARTHTPCRLGPREDPHVAAYTFGDQETSGHGAG